MSLFPDIPVPDEPPKRSRATDEIWEALIEVAADAQEPLAAKDHTRLSGIVSALRTKHATPAEIKGVAAICSREYFKGERPTAECINKWFNEKRRKVRRQMSVVDRYYSQPCAWCGRGDNAKRESARDGQPVKVCVPCFEGYYGRPRT